MFHHCTLWCNLRTGHASQQEEYADVLLEGCLCVEEGEDRNTDITAIQTIEALALKEHGITVIDETSLRWNQPTCPKRWEMDGSSRGDAFFALECQTDAAGSSRRQRR